MRSENWGGRWRERPLLLKPFLSKLTEENWTRGQSSSQTCPTCCCESDKCDLKCYRFRGGSIAMLQASAVQARKIHTATQGRTEPAGLMQNSGCSLQQLF